MYIIKDQTKAWINLGRFQIFVVRLWWKTHCLHAISRQPWLITVIIYILKFEQDKRQKTDLVM